MLFQKKFTILHQYCKVFFNVTSFKSFLSHIYGSEIVENIDLNSRINFSFLGENGPRILEFSPQFLNQNMRCSSVSKQSKLILADFYYCAEQEILLS